MMPSALTRHQCRTFLRTVFEPEDKLWNFEEIYLFLKEGKSVKPVMMRLDEIALVNDYKGIEEQIGARYGERKGGGSLLDQ
jgi:hypothetical protein